MEDTKAIEFFRGVLSKTRAGRIGWQPTATESAYIAAIGGKFILSVWQYEYPDQETFPFARYSLAVKDQDGRVLTTITSSDAGIAEGEMRELYELVSRQAFRVNEKIDQVLGELSKL